MIQDGETLDANHGKTKQNTGAQCVGQESRHWFPKVSNLPNTFKFHLPVTFQHILGILLITLFFFPLQLFLYSKNYDLK